MSRGAGQIEPRARTLASRLAHDVGKYISRAARNLPDGEVPRALVRLLIIDLFETDGARRASAVFEELAEPLCKETRDQRLDRCREMLGQIDLLEEMIRGGEDSAVRRAADMAIEIDSLLRAVAAELDREA